MLRAVLGTTVTNVAIQALNLVSSVLLARFLGPHGRGELATAMLWPSLIANIGIMGADVALGRKAARETTRVGALNELACVVAVLLGALFVLIGSVWLPLAIPKDKAYLLPEAEILLITVPFGILNVLLATVQLGRGAYRAYNGIRVVYALLYAVTLGAAFMVFDGTLDVVVTCLVVVSIAGTIPFVFVGARSTTFATIRNIGSFILEPADILRSGLPFGVAGMLGHVTSQLPVMLLTYFTLPTNIGLFVVATAAASLHLSFGAAWSKVLFAHAAAQGEAPSKTWLVRKVHQSMLAYVFISVAMLICVPPVIPFMFGTRFEGAASLAFWLIPVTGVAAVSLTLEEALRARGISKATSVAKTLGALTVTSIALLALPKWNTNGLIAALAATAAVELATYLFFCTRAYRIQFSDLIRIDFSQLASSTSHVINGLRKKS